MKYSLSTLALLGFVTHNDVVQAIQNQHHHHQLAQDEPKAVTPDSNREIFDKDVKIAANVVKAQN